MMELNTTAHTESEASTWRASLNSVIVFVATLLVAWIFYRLLRVVKVIAETFREVFLFWNIALSTSQRTLKRPLRLHPYLCETSYLDEVGANELFHFYMEDIHAKGGIATVEYLHKVIMQYTHILMCRDRMDGTLRGAMLLGIEHKGDYTLIKLGLALFKNYYRGSPFIKIIIIYLVTSELMKHPLTPVYVVGKVYGHKAYTFGLSMKEYYPVYNRETPETFKKIFADFAEGIVKSKAGRAKYNPETFVIVMEDSHLSENLTTLSEQELEDPHIKFFIERNPGWKKGHCLVVGSRITWWDYITIVKSSLRKILGKKKHHKSTKASIKDGSTPDSTRDEPKRKIAARRPKLLRRYSFQETRANTYAVNNLEYNIAGEVVLTPSSKASFTFQEESAGAEVNGLESVDFDIDLDSMT